MRAYLEITFGDGTRWCVTTMLIARNRAAHYAREFGGDVERSLNEDTIPCFADDFEIVDWASNNMNWSDIAPNAIQLPTPSTKPDYQREWTNAVKKVVLRDDV